MVTNRSAAPGPIAPVLVYENVGKAIDWLCSTFGFVERFHYGPEGNPSGAQPALGQGAVLLTSPRIGQSPEWDDHVAIRPPRSDEANHMVSVHVQDVDGHYEHAKACGAIILHPPETHPYGERQYTVQDIGGHRWTFTQSVADVAPQEWGGESPKPR